MFILELTASIIIFATGDKIVDEIINKADATDEWDQMKGDLFIVNYFVIGTLAV